MKTATLPKMLAQAKLVRARWPRPSAMADLHRGRNCCRVRTLPDDEAMIEDIRPQSGTASYHR